MASFIFGFEEQQNMSTNIEGFRAALKETLKVAENLGVVAVDVKSGNLHRRIGGYPDKDHRMPICCDAMR
jgi:5-methylcytosine-specific restriction protein A